MRFLFSKYCLSLMSVSLLLSGCDTPSNTQTLPTVFADMVLRNGVVVTVDDGIGNVQGIAVAGHKIIAVGNNEEIGSYINADTQVIDLAGRMAIQDL
jgi:hypothetical protein